MLANHRRVAPFGVAGGEPGSTGRNWIERAGGTEDSFGATFSSEVERDDLLIIQTPGGVDVIDTTSAGHAFIGSLAEDRMETEAVSRARTSSRALSITAPGAMVAPERFENE